MKLETFETLLLLLLFAVPGAVFLLAYSRAFTPSERAAYIQEQFPVELTILYLTASAVIHSILLIGLLVVLSLIGKWSNDPQIHLKVILPWANIASTSTDSLVLPVFLAIAYFFVSLVSAYFAGKWWAKRPIPAVPPWCKEILQLRTGEQIPQLKLWLRNAQPPLEGEWGDFRLLSRKQMIFEVAIRRPRMKQVIWIPSSIIAEMDVRSTQSTVKIVLAQQPQGGKEAPPSEEAVEPAASS